MTIDIYYDSSSLEYIGNWVIFLKKEQYQGERILALLRFFHSKYCGFISD